MVGHTKYRWKDKVEKDLSTLHEKNYEETAQGQVSLAPTPIGSQKPRRVAEPAE